MSDMSTPGRKRKERIAALEHAVAEAARAWRAGLVADGYVVGKEIENLRTSTADLEAFLANKDVG